MTLEITLPLADLIAAFTASNLIGKGIVLLQILSSIVVWTVMCERIWAFRVKDREIRSFRRAFSSSRFVLDGFLKRKRFDDPMGIIYTKTCTSLVNQISPGNPVLPVSAESVEGSRIANASLELVKGVAEESLATQQVELESGMTFLALGSSLVPLLGLLGTVWGILDAFQAMGAKGSALLSDVAPGLSSALLTTVAGLVVAIPSAIGYNFLLGKIRKLSLALDGFTDELIARLTGEFGRDNR